MKKILLMMLLLTVLASMLLAEDIQLQEITLDEFLNDYLSDYKIEKRIQLEGVGRDFAVAKETGEIVAVTRTDEKYIVKMLDLEGNCKWSHSFDNSYCNISALVSDNANTTTLFLNEGEGRGKNVIISKDGQILYESPISYSIFYPSPDGNYVYENLNIMGSTRQKEIKMYNKHGEKIAITGLENYQIRNIRIRITDNSHLIAFIEQENTESIIMCFCEFNKGNITVLWQYEFEEGYSKIFDTHNMATTNLRIFQNKIAVNACDSGFYIFNFDGNILHQDNELVSSFGFSQYGDFIIDNQENLKTFDKDNFNEKIINFSLKFKTTKENVLSFLKFGNFYLIDIERYFFQRMKYHTLFYENDKIRIINEGFYFLSLNNFHIIIAFNYEPNSCITIIYGGGK
ncbi:MAG: hypothetical protein HQ534_12765 [Armatimonadetes bacterium]|nr:hypothetical protein [Armatimonadota bacterium]